MDEMVVAMVATTAPRIDTADLIASTYDAHQRELYSFALRATHDPEIAGDLLHEAFTRLIVEVEAGRTPDNIRAWLYRVITNLIVSAGRRATVARRQLGALMNEEIDTGPEPAYLAQERRSDLEIALAELGEAERTALIMAANGFKGIEIAEAIGRSSNATRTMMCRSRVHLRQRLGSTGSPA
ncbi:MAG: RNA polymerase sigma factor [Chloroflexota bacterium]